MKLFISYFLVIFAALVALSLVIAGSYTSGSQEGYSRGWWAAAKGMCEEDMKGKLMSLPTNDWVQCVQYTTPAPLYPTAPAK